MLQSQTINDNGSWPNPAPNPVIKTVSFIYSFPSKDTQPAVKVSTELSKIIKSSLRRSGLWLLYLKGCLPYLSLYS